MRRRQPVWNEPEVPVAEIPGFENYCASKDGRIWSKPRYNTRERFYRGKWLRLRSVVSGVCAHLRADGSAVSVNVGRCVLLAWVGPPEIDECIGYHINHDPGDNRLCNLRWGTRAEQAEIVVREGKCNLAGGHPLRPRGITNSTAKLTEADVLQIRDLCKSGNMSLRQIALAYGGGVHVRTIWDIHRRRTWSHIPEAVR